ncbi:MAG TPA: hypothetical protein VLB73_01430 [Patescibacteria group bacterium]|nr:hypothetical protein [Patescibacteria group bacterium]
MKLPTKQFIPLILTVLTFLVLSFLLFWFIHILNLFPIQDKIILHLYIPDILVGLTIYLKTSVDFALFIGNLMSKYHGVKSRIAIEIGTAFGNALGTFFVLGIWTFFKEVPLLMIVMIFLASLVLLQMAENGLVELRETHDHILFLQFEKILHFINKPFSPLLRVLIPHITAGEKKQTTFLSLLIFALTIPLILGLDDFAGYIPLFNIINVFGFAVGVFLGHMLLNLALFASPNVTIALVRKPLIAFLGALAFVGIALWGFVEIFTLLKTLL